MESGGDGNLQFANSRIMQQNDLTGSKRPSE